MQFETFSSFFSDIYWIYWIYNLANGHFHCNPAPYNKFSRTILEFSFGVWGFQDRTFV